MHVSMQIHSWSDKWTDELYPCNAQAGPGSSLEQFRRCASGSWFAALLWLALVAVTQTWGHVRGVAAKISTLSQHNYCTVRRHVFMIETSAAYANQMLLCDYSSKVVLQPSEEFSPWGQKWTKNDPVCPEWRFFFTLEEACKALVFSDWSFAHTIGERTSALGISYN